MGSIALPLAHPSVLIGDSFNYILLVNSTAITAAVQVVHCFHCNLRSVGEDGGYSCSTFDCSYFHFDFHGRRHSWRAGSGYLGACSSSLQQRNSDRSRNCLRSHVRCIAAHLFSPLILIIFIEG